MSKLIRRQNNLKKAQIRFDKVGKRNKQIQLNFERSQQKNGKFRTHIKIKRGERTHHGNNRGLLHKAVGLKYRITGDVPSLTKLINNTQPITFKGKVLKKTAQVVNFVAHDAVKTAVDTGLAAETARIKLTDAVSREIVNTARQKYTREAVDDYHRGTFFIGKTAVDAVKGTHKHFRQKKQYKYENAKYRLIKAENAVFKHDKYKPEIKNTKSDLKSAKSEFKQYKDNFKASSKSNIQKALFIRRKEQFKQIKDNSSFAIDKLKSEKKFKSKELKIQRKIAKNEKTELLAVKPVHYAVSQMKASAWQKAVNEDADNDMLHAVDSAKRRIAEPVIQKASKQQRLQRQQKKRDKIYEKEKSNNKRLNKEENRLKDKEKNIAKKKKKPKPKKSFSDKLKDFGSGIFKFIKNVYENEVKKFFGAIAVIIIVLLLVFAFIVMIFSSISGGGGFTLGTYTAQDYDLSEAEKYYTKLAWDLNENVIKVGTDDWKKALKDLGADTSDYKDKPVDFVWGRSSHFNYDAVYDFDVNKLWGFLCAYYYDFDADNGDIKYWKFKESTKDLLDEIFNAEYEFQHFYDNTSHWEYRYNFEFCGYYSVDGSGVSGEYGYIDISYPDALPFDNYTDGNTLYYDLNNGEVLDYSNDCTATGWYLKNQYIDDYDESGTKYGEWYINGEDCNYGIWENDVLVIPNPYVITEMNWCSFLKKYDWTTDCRLYYNIKQKKTFNDVITEKLSSMSHSDERLQYYNLLIGADSSSLHGNHQTLRSLTGTGIHESTILNGYGYDMQGWNYRHCKLSDLHNGIDIAVGENIDIYAPFKCKIESYDNDKKTVILRKDDVEYWYDGTGGKKRDTEVTITNVILKDDFNVGDTLEECESFAKSTSHQYCDDSVQNAINNYIHVKVEIDTDGIGWDFIDPRLVFY